LVPFFITMVKYTLKLVEVKRVSYAANNGETLEVFYQIFQEGKKDPVWGSKQGMALTSTEDDIKAMLKQTLATYTQEHQPLSKEAKERLETVKKSDKVISDLKGFKL